MKVYTIHEILPKKQSEQSHIAILQDELTENKRAIKNLMSAIEQGIITDTTKNRLLELEREQSDLVSRIEVAKADIITVTKEDIISGLKLFRNGDITDSTYRAKLFDTFLVAVYLYDNDMKIIFSFTGNKNSIKIPLNSSFFDNSKENPEQFKCSYKRTFEPPYRSKRYIACSDQPVKKP